jgi:hypothetical protein
VLQLLLLPGSAGDVFKFDICYIELLQHAKHIQAWLMVMTTFDLDAAIERIKSFHAKPTPPAVDWYGQSGVIRQLLDLPSFLPLLVQASHGILLSDRPALADRDAQGPVLVQNRAVAKVLRDAYGRHAYAMGSFYVHHRRLNGIEQSPDARGTLAFPAHSTHLNELEFDWKSYALELRALPDRFHPITVCLYWKEVLEGIHLIMLDAGFEVATAGHMFDPQFTHNLYHLLRRHRYAAGNSLGSHLAIAVEMGIPYVHHGGTPLFHCPSGREPEALAGKFTELDWGTLVQK